MARLIFLDLETSGLEQKDRICEMGVIVQEGARYDACSSLCKSPKKISAEAMSLHHITNEMISTCQICTETDTYGLLTEHNQSGNVLIAHNSGFDLGMLEKEGFKSHYQIVDTLRCTKALIPECEQFSLQFLRYELRLYKEEKALADELKVNLNAHRALSDALHTLLLYRTLLEYATLSEMIEISAKPVLMSKLLFGKYNGRYIEEVAAADQAYLHWLLSLDDLDEDLAYSLRYYLQ